jgi:hypothetical protein
MEISTVLVHNGGTSVLNPCRDPNVNKVADGVKVPAREQTPRRYLGIIVNWYFQC